ncbi:MAG: VirB4 family type IV secretion system protein [bacterium]
MLNLKRMFDAYRKSSRSFSELVPPMALYDERTILNTDQSVMRCWTYEGYDLEGVNRMASDAAAASYEKAFGEFGENTIVWNVVERRRIWEFPDANFDNPVSQLINDEYRKQFLRGHCYQNHHSLVVQLRPNTGAESYFDTLDAIIKEENVGVLKAVLKAFRTRLDPKSKRRFDERRAQGLVSKLGERAEVLTRALPGLGMRDLAGEELLSYLHRRLNPATPPSQVAMPTVPCFLNTMLPTNTLRRQRAHLEFDGDRTRYMAVVTVKSWPGHTYPGQLDALLAIDGEITIAHAFRFIAREKATKEIQDTERFHTMAATSLRGYIKRAVADDDSGQVDRGRLQMAEEAAEAQRMVTAERKIFGYYTLTVLCCGDTEDEMQDCLDQVAQALRDAGYVYLIERMHALSAFAGTIPGQWAASVRWAFVGYANAADLVPIRTVKRGPEACEHLTKQLRRPQPVVTAFQTRFGTPFNYDLFDQDLGHGMVIGPPKMGKSTFMNLLIAQWQKYGGRTVIFDKDRSCRIPTLLQGGAYIDLTPGAADGARMNPMTLVRDRRHWPFLARWIEDRISARGYKVQPADRQSIEQALVSLHAYASRDGAVVKLKTLAQNLNPELKEQLQEWIGDGLRAQFFDADDEKAETARIVAYEMNGLFNDTEASVAMMDYLFYRIRDSLDGSVPCLIYLEEAWHLIREPRFMRKVDDWLRTFRKLNAPVWMATQSLAEVQSSDLFVPILDMVPNKVFLPNPAAHLSAELYGKFGLNDSHLADLAQMTPKREYLLITPGATRRVACDLPPQVVSCLTSSPPAQAALTRARAGNAPDWVERYLKEMAHA